MKKPILVVMAAGMGSRYGGLKQVDPVGSHGQIIIDYSIFDARRAGFETVVFIIKREIEDTFKQAIGDRLSKIMDVRYAYQQLEDLPEGYSVPEGRTKPWGTSHAILAARLRHGRLSAEEHRHRARQRGPRRVRGKCRRHPGQRHRAHQNRDL